MTKKRHVKDLKNEFQTGIIVDSEMNENEELIYHIEYLDKNELKTVKRQPYQIIYI
jgi:hypothetical protein